jgi:hypothetical protein
MAELSAEAPKSRWDPLMYLKPQDKVTANTDYYI